MKFSRIVLLIFLATLFTSYGTAQSSPVISEYGKLLSYSEALEILADNGKSKDDFFSYCCQYENPENRTKYITFEIEKAWFLNIKIDRRNLVVADMEGSCTKFFGGARDCTSKEVSEEFSKRLTTYSGFSGWYGKYHNQFVAYVGGKSLPRQRKFMGQEIHLLSRTPSTDYLLIGPFPEKPDRVVLEMHSGVKVQLLN